MLKRRGRVLSEQQISEARVFIPQVAQSILQQAPGATFGKILVIPPNPVSVLDISSFAPVNSGLTAAVAAATVPGSVIWTVPGTYTVPVSLADQVGLASIGDKTDINAPITLSPGSFLDSIQQTYVASNGSAISGVTGPATGRAYITDCSLITENTGAGDAYAVDDGGGELWVWNSNTYGNASGGGEGYGVRQTTGAVFVTEDGNHRGSTGKFSGTVQLFSFDDVIKLKTPGGFTKLFNGDTSGTGLGNGISAASSGDVLELPPRTIAGNHTNPSGVELRGRGEKTELTGTIINDGIISNVYVSGTLTNGAQGIARNVRTADEVVIWRIGRQGEGTTPPSYRLTTDGQGAFAWETHVHHEVLKFLLRSNRGTIKTFDTVGNPDSVNPVIPEGHSAESDYHIREIGNVLYEPGEATRKYKMLYTGYNAGSFTDEKIHYAYSEDGVVWRKYASNPLISNRRAEDPHLLKVGSTYYIYAEDKEADGGGGSSENKWIRRWSSSDFVTWNDDGQITLSDGGFAQSPIVWYEGTTWYMLYEQYPTLPQDIRLATSSDGLSWTVEATNPVFEAADTSWVTGAIVPEDIVKIDSTYYMTFHGYNVAGDWWGVGIATSTNLTSWTERASNPIEDEDGNRILGLYLTYDQHYEGQYTFTYEPAVGTNGVYRGYPVLASNTNTIASGSIEIDKDYHIVAAETGTSDDLDTINGGVDYQLLVLQADSGDTITVKHGTGNIQLNGATDFSLGGDKTLVLFYDGTNWADIGGGSGGVSTDTIWDAKGDLAAGTGSDTAQRLAVGSEGQILTPETEETTGLIWKAHFEILVDDGGNILFDDNNDVLYDW